MSQYLDFEKPIAQIAQRAVDYRAAGDDAGARHAEGAARRLLAETYARLSPWQKTLVARHPTVLVKAQAVVFWRILMILRG